MPSEEFMKWKDETNEVLRKANYRIIFLPEEDLMPYEHMSIDTELSNRVDETSHKESGRDDGRYLMLFTAEELDCLQMALIIYKTVLMEVHKEEAMAGIRRVIEALGKKQQEEDHDRQRED